MQPLSFAIVFSVPATILIGYALGGIYTFLTPFFIFVIVPIADLVIGLDRWNPESDAEIKTLEADRRYRMLTWVCGFLQIALLFWALHIVATEPLSLLELIGFTISMGIFTGGVGITVAHELTHRVNHKYEPLLARVMLWAVCYTHWAVHHVVGHHRTVATPDDPATARLGESFYAFWPRTVFGGFNHAWEFEVNRIRRKGAATWSLKNRIALYLLTQAILLLVIASLLGGVALLFFILQSIIAITLLELVNYVEHYGLVRRKIDNDRYEPVKPTHSWNANNWLTNRFLFNLQRHADHHYKPGRRYQVLRHFDESPQLPTGYTGMIMIALIPPLWRKMMDPLAEKFLLESD